MRKIYFRGKCNRKGEDKGKWFYGDLYKIIGGYSIHVPTTGLHYEVDSETVGQYTGLTDKNGARIFEGDILKSGCFGNVGFVKFGEYENIYNLTSPHLGFYVNWISSETKCMDIDNLKKDLIFWVKDGAEVIGNIYNNPELLTQKAVAE